MSQSSQTSTPSAAVGGVGDIRRHRGMLASYYGIPVSTPEANGNVNAAETPDAKNAPAASTVLTPQSAVPNDPCNLDSPAFSPELYLNKIMKEKSLTELMDTEHEMVRR